MNRITVERLKEIAALADELPDKYRVAAFQELVRHELGGNEPRGSASQVRSPAPEIKDGDEVETHPSSPERPKWFAELVDNMPDRHVFAYAGRDAQAAWALVELFKRGEPATVAAVRELIRVELGETPELRQHMSNRLGRDFTPRYADRIPHEGNAFRYEPTRRIVEKFPTTEGTE